MNYLISKILFFTTIISVSFAYDCSGRHCFIKKNEKNEVIFDCLLENKPADSIIKCSYLEKIRKIILTTIDEKYIPIDIIEENAFSRLVSGLNIDKIYINKLQFNNVNKDNFNGLENISEMLIENPKSLASDTFISLAAKSKHFFLTISCTEGNAKNSVDSIFLVSNLWRVITRNCYKKLKCEFDSCDTKSQSKMYKIIFSENSPGLSEQLTVKSCVKSSSCIEDQVITSLPNPSMKPVINISPVTTPVKVIQLAETSQDKSDDYYDNLMYIVLILTSINSMVILAILVFLIIWWKKLSTSTVNNKHTIILDDEDDNKFLNNAPYA